MSQSRAVTTSEYVVCARLARSLAHLIRGDLSVINNDLVYLSSLVPPEELERSRARCSQVASTLGKLGALSVEDERGEISGRELAAFFSASVTERAATSVVVCDRSAIGRAASALRELLGEWSGEVREGSDSASLSIELRREARHERQEEYTSLSDFAAAEMGERALIDACIAELILRNHGWRVSVSGGARVTIAIPCQERRS